MTENTFDLIALSRFNDFHPFPTVGALRQLYFKNTNGFAEKVVRKIGKRMYIKVTALQTWIEETNNNVA